MDYTLNQAAIAAEQDALEERRRIFEHLPIDPVHADWFRRRAWVRTLHGTTRIEGNSLSDLEVEELLADPSIRLPRREALEILGVESALEFVDETALRAEVPLDEAAIREIHRRVLGDISRLLTPGEYRRGENRVGDADGNIIFTTPPSGDVPELMHSLGDWLRSGYDDLPGPVAAAVTHLEFVGIHPFYDGNGRTARGIARFLLLRHDYAMDGIVSLDAYLDSDRTAYFSAIRDSIGRAYEPGYDATPFVIYFLKSIVAAADHVLARLRGLGEVLVELRRAILSRQLPPPLLDGLAYAWINRSMRPADYIRITGRSPQTTTRDLTAAVDQGFLLPQGERRSRRYLLGGRLASLGALAPEGGGE